MSSSNGNGNGNSGNGFMSGIGGRLWGGDKDSSSATATTTSAAAAPAPPRRTQRERVDRSNNNNSAPVAAAAPPPPPSSAGGSRRMHSTTSSSTQPADDTASPSSTTPRAARVRPPSTYAAGGDVSALQSQSLNQQQQQQQSPRRERERPDRDFSLSADRMPDSSLAQSNKERDIARRHQFRQEQLRALREREEQEALMPSPPPTTTLVNVVDAPINVVVIPGYGNDDDYVLDYLSASSGDESEYHSDKKEKRPQRHTKFSPNHRSLPTTSAVARPGGSKRKNAGNRVSFDISKQSPGLKPTTRIPSNTGRERIPSTSIPQQVPRTNSGGRSARTAGATRGSATGADEEGDVGWDDVYDQPPGSPSMMLHLDHLLEVLRRTLAVPPLQTNHSNQSTQLLPNSILVHHLFSLISWAH
ncbi:hypothetical protein BCR33DRAFT_395490 [Rhizoclosmatium globosum]|uniref:Uncharacterized protein n=1 Tax=Rhizoclosmatium globosum TaxID=329046 RepID=A0A1Y2CXN0_9FUNG|nr:hypothetical protein BCR33DRAFT_395490 [Rhizoclosmatium globosum]|eukprot:ORY51780.1 hypothetical protein BCR33DRAFT_395490 [Rhizoclosmatium globosum]